MIRDDKTPQSNKVIADMSQFSIESGRLSIEQQYDNLQKERNLLTNRKLKLEQMLVNYKTKYPSGRGIAGEHKQRREIIDEITDIQQRLVVIKPAWHKLRNQLYRPQEVILEDILLVLKQIVNKVNK